MRWWVPAALVVLLGGFLARLYATAHFSRYVASVALPLIGVVLVALWYIFLTGKPWKRRLVLFLVFAAVMAGGIAAVRGTLRWEGSLSGGAVPRIVWIWSKGADADLKVPEPIAATPYAAPAEETAASYPRFLGPDGDGVLRAVSLEPDWGSYAPKERWRRRVGLGWGGFVVSGGRAITQEQRAGKELTVCYDVSGGEPLWVHENETRFSETMGGDGPRATPTIDGEVVFVMGATGIADCLRLENGEVVWSRHILEENGAKNPLYGKANSPVVEGDMLLLTGGEAGGPSLLALNRETGETLWKAGDDAASYATPVVASLAGKRQVICNQANAVMGHDLESGKILWRFDWPAKMPKSSQPQIVGENRVFVSASYGLGCLLFEVSPAGEEFETREVWRNNRMKTKFSNVCVRDGFAYGLDEGRMACVDLATGERTWKGGKYGYGQNLIVGEHILVQTERGDVALVEANPEAFVEVARLKALEGKTWNYPALAGGLLLVRNDREAVCFEVTLR